MGLALINNDLIYILFCSTKKELNNEVKSELYMN